MAANERNAHLKTGFKALLIIAIAFASAASCATRKTAKPFSPDDEDVYVDFYEVSVRKPSEKDKNESEPQDPLPYQPSKKNTSGPACGTRWSDVRDAATEIFSKNLMEPVAEQMPGYAASSIIEYKFTDGKIYTMLVSTEMMTDFRMESGENIMGDIAIADQSLLVIDPVVSIEDGSETAHLLFRATASEGQTTIIIPTTKRTYYFKVKLTDGIGMFGVRFKYDKKAYGRPHSEPDSTEQTPELRNLRNLDYDYFIFGDSEVKPVTVFSDKKSTYIQFSKKFYTTDINPALYLQDDSGLSIINYTIRGNMYVVDFILGRGESFMLASGKKKSTIEREFFTL